VLERFHAALPEMSLEQADWITRKVETYPNRLLEAARYRDDYAQIWRVIVNAVADISGAACMVDSSKTGQHSLYRPISLAEAGFDVSVIHMVRDPRAVAWSKFRRELNKGHLQHSSALLAAAVSSGIHWSTTNLSTSWVYHQHAGIPYLGLHHEDFVNDPVGSLHQMEQTFHIDLHRAVEIVQRDEPILSGHLASGNEIRLKAPLHIERQPPTWKTALPGAAKLGLLVTAPAAVWYHYHITDYH
jgi:hypothetical protein